MDSHGASKAKKYPDHYSIFIAVFVYARLCYYRIVAASIVLEFDDEVKIVEAGGCVHGNHAER